MLKSLLMSILGGILLVGCAASNAAQNSQPSAQRMSECLVCKKNADLACVDVTVTGDTPHAEFGGQTYYFCSEECRAKFVAAPARYVSSASH